MRLALLTVGIILLLTACSDKLPPPVQLEKTPAQTINYKLLETPKNVVPKSVYLNQNYWDSKMVIHKHTKYYFTNDKIIKAFYLAHHANKIQIQGDKKLIQRYKNYLRRNAVTAKIVLKPNPYYQRKSNKVTLYFQHNLDKVP